MTPLERRIELPDMVAYAGATWDWHRMHYDTAYAGAHGLPAPIVDGQLLGALLAETAQDWLGPAWRLAELSFRFAEPVYAGDTVRCTGEVTASDDRRVECALRVEVVDQAGAVLRTAVAKAAAALVRRAAP